MSTVVLVCILAVIPHAGQESDAGGDKKVLSYASLSNPDLRSHVVVILAEQSRAAKAGAWRKAQILGWHVKGHADGACFELMTLTDGRPIYNITNNVNAAISTAAHLVRNTAPYNVDGSGYIVGVWDAGGVLPTHQELDGRVTICDGADSHWHSTHVGGTIGAAGIQPNAMGMAPEANIASYDWDLASSEMTDRAASYPEEPNKIYLSNHSYGITTGWTTGDYSGNSGFHWFGVWGDREADGFGQYSSETVTWDSICYSAPYYLPFKSAGNDRGDHLPSEGETFYYYDGGVWQSKSYNSSTDPYADNWDNGGFDTIPHRGNAKNILTVGAVGDAVFLGQRSLANGVMTSFSSWGPTDDGRIKPDIVANGADLYSCTDDSDSSYDTFSGTSMSAPDAAGSAILLAEYYGRLFGGEAMRSSTLKGLIIHTADDLGNTGPDYSFGWGLMNTKAAAEQIREHGDNPSENKIVEGLLDAGNPEDSYTFVWNTEDPIRATLCWTDPPAEALVELDNPSPRLLNDLDLRVIDPCSSVYYPFVLDPANPAEAAATGDNTVDNVEQVLIGIPSVEGIYTVEVSYKGTLTNNAQHYSLIISGQHHLPGPAGIILLDKDTYSCDDLLEIELRDGNLVGNNTQAILVSTNGADSETVTLYEDSYRGGVFTGTIRTESEIVEPEDGMLQVGHGQTITATYEDANTGTGSPATVTDIAEADCQAPVIVNVQVGNITSSGAYVTFETDEAATARIKYGLTCNATSIIIDDKTLATEHCFYLSGLTPETDYYFELTVWDSVDNETTDDNGGLCYQFTTAELLPGIRVPADYTTIQEAIDVIDANNVDTIIVADGIYTGNGNRDIDFYGKAITVKSENGPGNCIIDCQGSGSSPHRGFHFHNGEGKDSIVSGFTIKNGFGPEGALPGEMGTIYLPAGGAIFCESSSPTIYNCIFSDNNALNPDYYNFSRGGAIACTNASPKISSSTFADNEVGCDGGAIYGYGGALTIANCTFNNNISHRNGGAIECEGGRPRIENCTISNNRSNSYGGGIYCEDSVATIINCVVNNNIAYDPDIGNAFGGGMELQCNRGQVIEVINCTIIGNWAENSGGGLGTSCCGNYEVVNSIVWNNFPGQINALHETVVTHCNIQGGFSGEGNINIYPMFVSGSDYHLGDGSPCIDAGTNDVLSGFPSRDLEGTPRPLDGDDNQTDIADMGAYEYWNQPSGPFIALDADKINLFAFPDGNDSGLLSIRNGWIGTLNWQVSEDCIWLGVSPIYGDSTGEINEITITADATGLSTGDYHCNLTISGPNATNGPFVVPIQFRVGARLVPQNYTTIQAAIDSAKDADIIIVADGTYTGTGNRAIDFKGKAITVMSENGPDNCIIDCQNLERAFNFHSFESNNSILNGFTIRNGTSVDYNGGGIKCVDSSPSIMNCWIINCHSYPAGGGIFLLNSTGKVVNSIITGCTANNGGAIQSEGGYPEILNCTITGNSAAGGNGGGYYCRYGDGAVKNSIFWGNGGTEIDSGYSDRLPTVSYTDVQGGFSGVGNIDAEPCFATGPLGDYYLSQIASGQAVDSPCVDAGSDTAANLGMDEFTTRTDEIRDRGIVDLGYHYLAIIEYGNPDIDGNLHVDLLDYSILAGDWMNCSHVNLLPGDIAKNGCVDINDIRVLVDRWLDCFMTKAINPNPANEAGGVDPNVTLSWVPGMGALYHDVYFGTDANAVANAGYLSPEFMGTVSEANFDPCGLEWETIYCWRIDEVGQACSMQGEVWNFTTQMLIGWWKFDEGSGTTAYDSVGENDGTIYGASWTTGKVNAALSFDGMNDYVYIPYDVSLDPDDGPFSVAAWVKTNVTNEYSNTMVSNLGEPIFWGVFIRVGENHNVNILILDNFGNGTEVGGTTNIEDGNWHYIVTVRDENNLYLYVDGVCEGTPSDATSVGDVVGSAPWIIGALKYPGPIATYFFNGVIDEVAIYNWPLSAGEIEQLYQNELMAGP